MDSRQHTLEPQIEIVHIHSEIIHHSGDRDTVSQCGAVQKPGQHRDVQLVKAAAYSHDFGNQLGWGIERRVGEYPEVKRIFRKKAEPCVEVSPQPLFDGTADTIQRLRQIGRQRVEALGDAKQIKLILVREIVIDNPLGYLIFRTDRI